MLLNEIKMLNVDPLQVTEGIIPVHISMTLQQIIDAGKVTNSVQTFILAELSNMFKQGGPHRWPRDLKPYGAETPSVMIDAIRGLSDSEAVDLAQWFLVKLEEVSNFETNPYTKPEMDTQQWVRWVLSRQD